MGLLGFAMVWLSAACAPKPPVADSRAWQSDVDRQIATERLFLQDISLAGTWRCAVRSPREASFYRLLQSGPVTLLTDVATQRKLRASVAKLRLAGMTALYVLPTAEGPVYMALIENNPDHARYFATRYGLLRWSAKEPTPVLHPLREMTLADFKDNLITFKTESGPSSDEATCGPVQGALFPPVR